MAGLECSDGQLAASADSIYHILIKEISVHHPTCFLLTIIQFFHLQAASSQDP